MTTLTIKVQERNVQVAFSSGMMALMAKELDSNALVNFLPLIAENVARNVVNSPTNKSDFVGFGIFSFGGHVGDIVDFSQPPLLVKEVRVCVNVYQDQKENASIQTYAMVYTIEENH